MENDETAEQGAAEQGAAEQGAAEQAAVQQADYAAIVESQAKQIGELTATINKLISGGVQIAQTPPPAQAEPPKPPEMTVTELGKFIGRKAENK